MFAQDLQEPVNLTAVVDGANVHLEWAMPDTTQGIPSFSDDFNSFDFDNHDFSEDWEVIQGNGFAYEHEDLDPDVGYWFRTYYHVNPYHPFWGGNGNGHARVNWGNNIDTYLITPTIAVGNSTKIIFDWASSYTYNVPNDNGNFMVDVSIDGGQNWETVWHWDDIDPWNMWWPVLETTISLSDYSGQNVKIAFHYVQNDGTYLIMDNVTIDSSTNPDGTVVIWEDGKSILNSNLQKKTVIAEEWLAETKDTTHNAKDGLTGFKVYRDGAFITEISDPTTMSYIDYSLADGTYSYYVTAVYDDGESLPSNSAEAVVETNITWLYYGSGEDYIWPFKRNINDDSFKIAADFTLPGGNYYVQELITSTWVTMDAGWKFVTFDDSPTENVIGSLEGNIETVPGYYDGLNWHFYDSSQEISDDTPLSGHFAVIIEIPEIYNNYVAYQEMVSGQQPDGTHAWYQAVPQEEWMTLDYMGIGAWNIRLKVSDETGAVTEILPNGTILNSAYPNPFNPATTISYQLSQKENVELTVFNAKGQKISTLVNETVEAGMQTVPFDAENMSSGIYFYHLKTGNKTLSKRMILMK